MFDKTTKEVWEASNCLNLINAKFHFSKWIWRGVEEKNIFVSENDVSINLDKFP